jgi:hypothetical protein
VRPGKGYRSADAAAVRDDILERIGTFKLDVIEVPEIPKTLQGKTALVVRIPNQKDLTHVYDGILQN